MASNDPDIQNVAREIARRMARKDGGYDEEENAEDHTWGREGYIPRLCFTCSLDGHFLVGAEGLIRSIRKFYSAAEADIVAFVDHCPDDFRKLCADNSVELRYSGDINAWVQPLIYQDPRYASDTTHFYHPGFEPITGIPEESYGEPGFGRIHNLHRLNVKAYCTGYCLCVRKYERVVLIDPDAFLLGRLDDIFDEYQNADTMVAFQRDGMKALDDLEALFCVKQPEGSEALLFDFNSSLVFYVNGPGGQILAKDFMFYIESCYHWNRAGQGGQGENHLLRLLAAKHSLLANIECHVVDGRNWNPKSGEADELHFDSEEGIWRNCSNGQMQHAWRLGDGDLPPVWTARYHSSSVNAAWEWVGGTHYNWDSVHGCLPPEVCEFVAGRVASYLSGDNRRTLDILEMGTFHGRTALAWTILLGGLGFEVRVDACDNFSWLDGSKDVVERNVRNLGLSDRITVHHVDGNENLVKKFGDRRFDFIYVDASHDYKPVLADIIVALKLAKRKAIIVGDDFGAQFPGVPEAVLELIHPDALMVNHSQWIVHLDDGRLRNMKCSCSSMSDSGEPLLSLRA